MSDAALGETILQERIGPYRVEGILGQGGMGVVVRARAPDGTAVAVKSILGDRASPELQARFEREAAIRLDHPNIIRTLDTGIDERGHAYIVFELLDGESLDRKLERDGTLSPIELVRILREACAGLEAAHAQGIVHRDLKPANIFVCRDGRVKLLDFGIALVRTARRLTMDAALLGTPAYFSPEQSRSAGHVDGRTDVWALGVLAYEALSGSLPFERATALLTLVAIIQDSPPPLDRVAPRAPGRLCDVVMRCLEKDAARRWPTPAALAAALDGIDLSERVPDASSTPDVPRTSIRPDELRMVVVVLARGVDDVAFVEAAVRHEGGEPLPLLGGDVLGVFGAAVWRGDEAGRAARAALAVRHVASCVAVSSGRASAAAGGLVGEGLAWAQGACERKLDGVAVDARTARALGDSFVRGEPRTDDVVEVVAEIASDPGAEDGEPTELVGREREAAAVRAAIARSRERATTVVLTGPAGIGKTRLRREVERLIRLDVPNAVVLVGSAEPLARESAFGTFATALRRHAHRRSKERGWPPLRNDAPPLAQRQAVLALAREAIVDRDRATRCAEFLGVLLGVPFPSGAAVEAQRSPELMADGLRFALLDYFGNLARRHHVTFVLEGLDWTDPVSARLIVELSHELASAPFLALVTARSAELAAKLDLQRDAVRVDLGGLSLGDVRAIADRAAGRTLPDDMLRTLARRTEGNPLFVEQIATVLGERGAEPVREETGQVDLGRLPLPFTVEGAIQSRLDDLPLHVREACKAASVYGRPVQIAEIEALGIDDARVALAGLEERHLVEPCLSGRASGTVEMQFVSSLVASVAYRSIAREARVSLHLRAADHLSSRTMSSREEIALHYERGEAPARAAAAYAAAAMEAAALADADRVLRCSARALELDAPHELRFALHAARADTLRFLRRKNEQAAELEKALAVARTPAERARALTEQAFLCVRMGDRASAVALSGRAVEEAEASGELETRALAHAQRGRALVLANDVVGALAAMSVAAECAQTAGPWLRALVQEVAVLVAAARGDLGGVLDAVTKAVELYRLAGDVRRCAQAEANLADCYNRIGDYAAAEAALREALVGVRRVGNRVNEGYVLANLGYALARSGHGVDALATLAEVDAIQREAYDPKLDAAVRVYTARAAFAAGRPEDAVRECLRAVEIAPEAGQDGYAAVAEALAAEVALSAGDVRGALDRSEAAMRIFDSLAGGCEDEAEIFVTRVAALRAARQDEDAEVVRARGAARVRSAAQRIDDPGWRARFLAGVAAHRVLLESS